MIEINEKKNHPTYCKGCILYAGMQWQGIHIMILSNQRQTHINNLKHN